MSLAARQALVNSGHLIFRKPSQKADLLNEDLTQTGLIALLEDIAAAGFFFEVTAVRSDHPNDSDLGFHCHAHGFCMDGWPLRSATAGDYLEATDPQFAKFCHTAGFDAYEHQEGLAGSAWTHTNAIATGSSVFHDAGADHIHLGAK